MTKAKKLAGAGDVVVHVQSSKKKREKKKKYIKKIWQNNKHHYIHKEDKKKKERNYVLAPHVKMIKAFTVILNLGQIRLTLCNHM